MTHKPKHHVKTRFWNTRKNPDFFPELDDPDFSSNYVRARRNFGVCFSGGGTRSASATIGQLRGLKLAGLLDKLGYISAVSGGSWGSAAFIFLPADRDEATFLGQSLSPEDITMEALGERADGSMSKAISKTVIGDDILKFILSLAGDEAYSRVIGQLFLEPFQLHSLDKSVAFDPKTLKTSLLNNRQEDDPDYYLTENDFIVARANRPFYIANATILRKHNDDVKKQKIHCEFTPIYSGVRAWFPDAGRRFGTINGVKRPIGGGYIQSYAYDSSPEEVNESLISVECARSCFTLSDIIGSSGAAPEETVRQFGMTDIGFPEFRHFPIPQGDSQLTSSAEYAHGDGGNLENFGLMPLLARKVSKIIVFVNSLTPFCPEEQQWDDNILPLFGMGDCSKAEIAKFDPVKVAVNQVFAKKKFRALIQGLAERKNAGQSLVYCDDYEILANSHYNIGPYRASICWVYLDCPKSWKNQLSDDFRPMIGQHCPPEQQQGQLMFERFPHYRTFRENSNTIIDLTIEQVNLLSHLSCWTVLDSKEMITKWLTRGGE